MLQSQDAEASATTKPAFIVDDDIIDETEEAESDDEEQGDKVCAICDNGGDILWYANHLFHLPT